MTKRLLAIEDVLDSYKECVWWCPDMPQCHECTPKHRENCRRYAEHRELCQQQLARFEKECIERGVGKELYSFFELLDSGYLVDITRSEKRSFVEVTINADILVMFHFNQAELLDYVDYVCLHTGEVMFEERS